MGYTLALSSYCIAQAAQRQKWVTMDTDYCGNWFPRGESIDNGDARDFMEIA